MEKRLNQQEEIERLFTNVREYYKSKNFWTLMKFCARFKHLSAYNAWMAQLQCPSARYMLTEGEWRNRYNRKLRTNAKPIIILIPFGPIDMVFEIGDTMPIENKLFAESDEDILSELEKPYLTKGHIESETLNRLICNLQYSGIALEYFDAASNLGAEINVNHEKPLTIKSGRRDMISNYPNDYLVSINSKADAGTTFASLCHELGHLFCHHLPNCYGGWKTRNLTHAEEEFEAETVSWLVCERAGVENPSEKYLAGYMKENGTIPPISINSVLLSVNEIERMMRDSPSEALKHGLLYRHSDEFKALLKDQQQKN